MAREQFFEEGQRPSGLVPEPVIQSWSRCMGSRRKPDERIEFRRSARHAQPPC
jgi:transcriptional regulator of acetoin/glycerol metabolism